MKYKGCIAAAMAALLISTGLAAENWSAGPGLYQVRPAPAAESLFVSTEWRDPYTTAKLPVYKGTDDTFRDRFTRAVEKEVSTGMAAIRRVNDEGERQTGWITWQMGASGNYTSLVFLKSVMYDGAAHPVTYVRGMTFDDKGRLMKADDLLAKVPGASLERLRKGAKKALDERGVEGYENMEINEFPQEFYIGSDGELYFIFQQYDIAPYAAGWVTVSVGEVKG